MHSSIHCSAFEGGQWTRSLLKTFSNKMSHTDLIWIGLIWHWFQTGAIHLKTQILYICFVLVMLHVQAYAIVWNEMMRFCVHSCAKMWCNIAIWVQRNCAQCCRNSLGCWHMSFRFSTLCAHFIEKNGNASLTWSFKVSLNLKQTQHRPGPPYELHLYPDLCIICLLTHILYCTV